MRHRGTFAFLLLFVPITLAGCAICDNCDDEAFAAYGGAWERTDRYYGRVGSVFAPAGAPTNVSAVSDQHEMAAPAVEEVPWEEEAETSWLQQEPSIQPY